MSVNAATDHSIMSHLCFMTLTHTRHAVADHSASPAALQQVAHSPAAHPLYLLLLYEVPELGVCHLSEPIYPPHGLRQAFAIFA